MKNINFKGSPNFSSRKDSSINMIILHHTGSESFNGCINWFMKLEAQVSAHFIIGREGQLVQMVEIEKKAWHAGRSQWNGIINLNKYSIGIELCGDGNKMVYAEAQYKTLIELLKYLMELYKIDVNMILGHEDVSPGRKVDPGKLFDWAKIRAEVSKLDIEPIPDFKEIAKDDGYQKEVFTMCSKFWNFLKKIKENRL